MSLLLRKARPVHPVDCPSPACKECRADDHWKQDHGFYDEPADGEATPTPAVLRVCDGCGLEDCGGCWFTRQAAKEDRQDWRVPW